jgi:FlaA1/EpsC-like NDP-sugar epimerase
VREAGLKVDIKVAPSVGEMLRKPVFGMALREVKPADLLSRKVINLDEAGIARNISGKVVLVTGAGGTIGGELSRQALRYGPSKLILLDNHGTSLLHRELELREKSRKTQIIPILGSIRDSVVIETVFNEHKPHGVLHAAAHKHVAQLEESVHEGVQNNLLGTFKVAKAAAKHSADFMLLISTDKAVNPSCVMGATKRIGEMVIQSFAEEYPQTRFLAVRFGNVLGSSGSVLKIFQEQIAKGGPLTLTHPEMTRYFMTVEEAVQLIMHTATMAAGGEIFILRMGKPVKILDMAKSLILLNELEPEKDIQIEFMGMRPGEKLHEELIEHSSEAENSAHPQIMKLKPNRVQKLSRLEAHIDHIEELAREGDRGEVLKKLHEMVPSFVAVAKTSLPVDPT